MGSAFNPARAAVDLIPKVMPAAAPSNDAAKKDAYTSQINSMNQQNQRAQTQALIESTTSNGASQPVAEVNPTEASQATTAELRKKFNLNGDASDSIRI